MPTRRAPPQAPPEFIALQLATLVSTPPIGAGWVYEIKLDGYRILARVHGKDVRMFTRRGNDWTADMQHLAEELAELPTKSAWLDGEVVVLGTNGLPEFNALQNAFDRKGTQHLVYFVFDLLSSLGTASAGPVPRHSGDAIGDEEPAPVAFVGASQHRARTPAGEQRPHDDPALAGARKRCRTANYWSCRWRTTGHQSGERGRRS